MVRCGTCGTENERGAGFCSSCGNALGASRTKVATIEPVPVPEWLFPARVAAPAPLPEMPRARSLRFLVLFVVWLGVFLALPAYTIWSTSPTMKQIGIAGLYDRTPTCEESARAAGEDPELCQDSDVRARFEVASDRLTDERVRVLKIAGSAYAALALATIVLVMAAGLRPWWAFSALVSPLNLVVWTWSLWRLSAWPQRPWERSRR